MRMRLALIAAIVGLMPALPFAAEEVKPAKKGKSAAGEKVAKEEKASTDTLPTFSAKISYALGMQVGNSIKDVKNDIDLTILLRGLKDALDGKPPELTPEQLKETMGEFMKRMQAARTERNKDLGEKNRKEEEAFLATNAKKKGVTTTDSGLQYEVLSEGNGPKPKESDKVTVHYRGTLLDGTEFDSSLKGDPVTFPVTKVIAGWTEGVQLMKVGSKYRFFIPSKLAYKEFGAPPRIGPNAMLIFEVELLKIE